MSNKRAYAFLPAHVYVGTNKAPNLNEPKQRGNWKPQKEARKSSNLLPLNPHWCAPLERLKEKEGTRQTPEASPVYQKHRLLQTTNKRSRLPSDYMFNGRGILTVQR